MASMRLPQLDYPSDSVHPHTMMTDGLQYPSPSQYAQGYYPGASLQGHIHPPSAIPRPEQPVRKRPKYTRSKTGCLTCRAKKVKCDEAKPDCTRCQQGQRECKWPEGVPARKKPAAKKETLVSESPVYDGTRPSTACSSVSDLSTPPTRNHTPPKLEPFEQGLPPMVSRRQSDNLIHVPIALKVDDTSRLHSMPPARPSGYPVQANTHTHIISGPGMLDTSSQYPTHGSYHDNTLSAHHYATGQSLALPRLPAHHSSPSPRFEHHQHWNTPQILHTVDPIQPYFPSAEERNLIRHYCDNALSLMMALPSENPVLAANMQLLLGRAPGSDVATEALRHALLGVAAMHKAYSYSRSGVSPMAEQSLQLAHRYRSASQRLLSMACMSSDGMQSDASLAASAALSLADIFAGGYNWTANMNTAKSLVNMRGGPAVLLARSARPRPGTVTGVSRARLYVEIISIYDIFGSLVAGSEPTLLSSHTHCWWLESANSDDIQSYMEKYFGMSRTFVPLLVKVVTLLSRSLARQARPDDPAEVRNRDNATTLYNELEKWRSPPGLPERVETGNCIYRNAAQIVLLRDIFQAPAENDLVQRHADVVLSLCFACGKQKLSVDLNWPVIIAGAQVYGTKRVQVLEIFECFREQCCYEIETSEHIVLEVWKRIDSNHPEPCWRSVVREENLNVLIL